MCIVPAELLDGPLGGLGVIFELIDREFVNEPVVSEEFGNPHLAGILRNAVGTSIGTMSFIMHIGF